MVERREAVRMEDDQGIDTQVNMGLGKILYWIAVIGIMLIAIILFLLVAGWIIVHMTLMLLAVIIAGTIAWYYATTWIPGGRKI